MIVVKEQRPLRFRADFIFFWGRFMAKSFYPALRRFCRVLPITLLLLALAGCGLSGLQDGLSRAVMNQPDPQTIREALPTFLVLSDALIEADPDDEDRLAAGADLYSAFAVLYEHTPERGRRLALRARTYGEQAFCIAAACDAGLANLDYPAFITLLDTLDERDDVPVLFSFATGWLAWANVNRDDWSVIADLPKIEAVLTRVVTLQEDYRQGAAHIYLGILKTLRPPSVGGKPEEARAHFERAIELSSGRNLSAKVDYAAAYARLIYDRELHDRLLHEVLETPVEAPGLTLLNTLAQERAQRLLASAEDYF
jgi:hypothetical protein